MSQNVNKMNYTNQDDIEAINVLVKEIVKAIRGNTVNCDRTYRTVIKRITKNGYVIIDETGSERTVPCYVPNVTLRVGQSVYVKEPLGNLKALHICNVIGNTGNASRRR